MNGLKKVFTFAPSRGFPDARSAAAPAPAPDDEHEQSPCADAAVHPAAAGAAGRAAQKLARRGLQAGKSARKRLKWCNKQIVWSYSRSQAFFGSNLPSSPSFVQRYRRPARFSSDDEEGLAGRRRKSSAAHGADTDSVALSTTEDDASSQGDDDDREYADDGESGSEEDEDGTGAPWLADGQGSRNGEQLPWNALTSSRGRANGGGRRRRSSAKHKPRIPMFTASTSAQPPQSSTSVLSDEPEWPARPASLTAPSMDNVPASSQGSEPARGRPETTTNERTPLLEKLPRSGSHLTPEPSQARYSSSPPDAVPFPRRASHLKKRRASERRHRGRGYEIAGSSTSGQTLFNAINVLVGIGILALPLAFAQAGWVLGTILLAFCALLTNYTAKVLARALREDATLMTYADILAKAFGQPARRFINLLFCLEISALCVALIILLGDSLATLLPLPSYAFKLIGFAILFPTLFLPLRYLSIASLVGILSVVTLTITVLIDGCIGKSQPGSLRHPMPTSVGPRWGELPLAFGLIMSGFGGHAVFPSLARDMKKPEHFNRVCDMAFLTATFFYMTMGVLGYLMFGHYVSDEITIDLLKAPGLPRKLNLVAVSMVALTPICKYSLSSTPLESTISYILGVEQPPSQIRMKSGSSFKDSDFTQGSWASGPSGSDEEDASTPRAHVSRVASSISLALSAVNQPLVNTKPRTKFIARQVVKIVTALVLLAVAIFIPSFERVMGLLGAFSVFMICAIGPLAADLSLHRHSMSYARIILDGILIVISVAMALVGTVFVFLPKHR